MASKKKSQADTKESEPQPEWVRVLEGFLSAVTGALTGSVQAQAEAFAEDAEKRIARLIVVAFLGSLGFIYATIALIRLFSEYFSLATPWSYLIVSLLLIVAALVYSKR